MTIRRDFLGLAAMALFTASCDSGWLVVNEVQVAGLEPWVEIANTSHHDIDLTGYGVCIADSSGGCTVAAGFQFPVGTIVPAEKYLIVMTNRLAPDGVGPHTACTRGVQLCYYSDAATTETAELTVVLIDEQGEVVSSLTSPANIAVESTVSWAIVPDQFGEPQTALPTPGDPNHSL